MKLFTLLLPPLLSAFGMAFAEVPAINGAEVTIPYSELKQLLDAAARADEPEKAAKPPVDSVLISSRYHLDLSEPSPSLTADYETRTFTDAWHLIPLCGGEIRLKNSETDADSSVARSVGHYALLTSGIGEQKAQLEFAVSPAADWDWESGLSFSPPPASVSELRVTGLPEGRSLEIEGLAPSSTEDESILFHLPADSCELNLLLRDAAADRELPAVPSAWTLHSQILVRFADGRLQHSARIQAQAENGSGLSLSVMLPPKAGRIVVDGEDLDRFELKPREETGRRVQIDWKTRGTLDRTFLMSWEIPQSSLADSWTLTPPRAELPDGIEIAAPAGESRSLIVLVPIDGLDLTNPVLQSAVESRQMPAWLREQLGADESLTAEITGTEPIDLKAVWLPRVETAQATVSQATFDTRLVADGSILVTADYTIQHNAPIDWQVDLPAADQILTCEVNRKSVKPIQRSDNQIEFRLPMPEGSTGKDAAGSGSQVHLCYSLKVEPLDPVSGRVSIELPQTDLFIHRLDWSLAIPERYEPTAIEGNVELAPENPGETAGASNTSIRLTKELCRDERPAVEIFYQRKDLNTGS